MTHSVTVLGSTGSVGCSTLDVIARHPDKFSVAALSANTSVDKLFEQCSQFNPEIAVMADTECARQLESRLKTAGMSTRVRHGEAAAAEAARGSGEIVVCGIVGAAGLMSVIAAAEAGKRVLIANKEPLVMLGHNIIELARKNRAILLPLDSEHNAIFQCLPQQSLVEHHGAVQVSEDQGVQRILLTGSGGPFRTMSIEQMRTVTPEQALNHPNWKMGRKISVDSATMMNKGLELIEACVLFGVPEERVDIVIHPQSIIHSMVEYIDGSVISQLGTPDMRVPIASALAWPGRIESGASRLDFSEHLKFDFEQPDPDRFPALRLAREAARTGGTLPTIMSAANEVAVYAFLEGQLTFDKIATMVEWAMENVQSHDSVNLDAVLAADSDCRKACIERLGHLRN